jgi:hypothetical protein
MAFSTRSQSGQIGVIIILIMVVLLTIGLSLVSQSSREVDLSRQEEESTRVFNAAEAGIEQALSTSLDFQTEEYDPPPTSIPGSNATVDYAIKKVRKLETRLFEGSGAHVQLADSAGAATVNTITIDWSKEKDCVTQDPASLIVSVYSYDSTATPPYSVRHLSYGACNRNDDITVAANAPAGDYFKRATIALNPKDVFLRIKPVYNDTHVQVTGSGGTGTLPVQYYNIRSEAKNQNGDETRIVEVNRTLSTAPSVMDYLLFSGTTLTK